MTAKTILRACAAAAVALTMATTTSAGVDFYRSTSRIQTSDGLLTFRDITQNGQTLVNYMDQGLTVDVNDFAFVFTPCGFDNPNIYYPNAGVGERITITRNDGRPFDILEMQISHGFAGCTVYAWITAYDGHTVVGDFDADIAAGSLIGLQGTFDRVDISSYNTPELRDEHNPANQNAIALDNMEYGRGASEYALRVTGQCPGRLTVLWSGADANAQQALVIGNNLGSTTIPSAFPCSGTVLGVQGGVMMVDPPGFFSTRTGEGRIDGNAGSGACGKYLQLVHGGTCETSNVVQIP